MEHKIQYLDPHELIGYELNNKIHDEEDVSKIADSIKKVGMRNPVEVDENMVILSGHGRVEAAKMLGLDKIPVIVYDDMDESQKKLYRHLANKTADFAEYDKEAIRKEIMESTGEERYTLEKLYEDFKLKLEEEDKDLVEEDEAYDEVPEDKLVVQFGDVFELKDKNMTHILVCGDSTIEKYYGDVQAQLLLTDPPYNVNYKGRGKKTSNGIANDNLKNDNFQFFLDDAYELIDKHTTKPASWYTFHGREWEECFKATVSKYTDIKAQIVWNKTHYNHVGGSYKRKHELCFYSIKGEEKFYGDTIFQADVEEIDWDKITPEKLKRIIDANREAEKHGKTTVWTEKKENSALYIHPTQKPVRLLEKMVLNSSLIGDTVLDPFTGSGSTLIACQKRDRNFYGIEMSPGYVQAVLQRRAEYTGRVAKDGKVEGIKCLNRDIDFTFINETD
jgi:site-specific DNA-methyltransferase (adenine-specific)